MALAVIIFCVHSACIDENFSFNFGFYRLCPPALKMGQGNQQTHKRGGCG